MPILPITTLNPNRPMRHAIDQLALNMGFGVIKPSIIKQPNTSETALSNPEILSNSIESISKVISDSNSSSLDTPSDDAASLSREISSPLDDQVQQRIITKVDPIQMVAKPIVIGVSKDTTRRAALLLNGPKFQLNHNVNTRAHLKLSTETIFPLAVGIKSRFIITCELELFLLLTRVLSVYYQ